MTESSAGLGRGLWAGILTLVAFFCLVLVVLGIYAYDRLSTAQAQPGIGVPGRIQEFPWKVMEPTEW